MAKGAHASWAGAAVLTIAAIAYWTCQYSIEEAKQNAFMMKACVDAGGQWMKNWGPTYNCARPGSNQ